MVLLGIKPNKFTKCIILLEDLLWLYRNCNFYKAIFIQYVQEHHLNQEILGLQLGPEDR